MLMALRLFLGIAILCASAADSRSQSQGPPASIQKAKNDSQGKPEDNQQNTTKNQSVSDEPPIATIKVFGPKPNATDGANQNTSQNQNYPTDWPMFWATIGIGCIGALQLAAFIKQAIYMRDSAEEMKKTTAAAEKASDDQIAHSHQIERAYISGGGAPQAHIVDLGTETVPGVMGGGRTKHLGVSSVATGYFRLDINNHGKTRGEIIEYGYGFCEADKVSKLPSQPHYRWVYYKDEIGPGTQSRPIKRVKIPKGKTVIFGRYGYRDIFDQYHSDGFIQDGGAPIAPPHSSYTEADPDWDLPHIGKRKYESEEPQTD
jgi:hypothetical protein